MDEKINEIKDQAISTAKDAGEKACGFLEKHWKKILVGAGMAGAAIGGFLFRGAILDFCADRVLDTVAVVDLDPDDEDDDDDEDEDDD